MVFGPAFGGCHGGLEEFLIDPPGVGGSDRARDAGRDPLIESLPDMIGTTTGGPFHSVPWSTRQLGQQQHPAAVPYTPAYRSGSDGC
jgi:hypothetical protein